jgi:hypothetical protein
LKSDRQFFTAGRFIILTILLLIRRTLHPVLLIRSATGSSVWLIFYGVAKPVRKGK